MEELIKYDCYTTDCKQSLYNGVGHAFPVSKVIGKDPVCPECGKSMAGEHEGSVEDVLLEVPGVTPPRSGTS